MCTANEVIHFNIHITALANCDMQNFLVSFYAQLIYSQVEVFTLVLVQFIILLKKKLYMDKMVPLHYMMKK